MMRVGENVHLHWLAWALVIWLQSYKTFSMLNSAEHEIYPADKC